MRYVIICQRCGYDNKTSLEYIDTFTSLTDANDFVSKFIQSKFGNDYSEYIDSKGYKHMQVVDKDNNVLDIGVDILE